MLYMELVSSELLYILICAQYCKIMIQGRLTVLARSVYEDKEYIDW